jgi:pimeloyl-ACP methyl ester carboxylesterase
MLSGSQITDPPWHRKDSVTTPVATRDSASLNGISLSWKEWPGTGRPGACDVVMLHGILQNADGMAGLAGHLGRFHRVVVPDLRGRGESERPADGYDPSTMAADVAALVEHLGLQRLVVIGRIDGGLIGYHLAADRPDLVHGLVLAETRPELDEARTARRLNLIRGIPRSFASYEEACAFYQLGFGASEDRVRNDLPHDMEEIDGTWVWRHDLDIIERIEAASAPRAEWDVLARVTAPTLVLRGSRGRLTAEMAARMLETLPQSELQTIFGASHDLFIGAGSEQAIGAVDMFLIQLNRA